MTVTLAELLKDSAYKTNFKWSQDGSNHPRFDEKELLRLPVPTVLLDQPDEYIQAVQTMIAACQKAAQLLDTAKRAVEIAIEQDERAALAYLEKIDCIEGPQGRRL